MLAVHGMSPYGNKDPRFINVCKSFAGCGFTVISPEFLDIKEFKIDPSISNQIVSVIEYITDNKDLCPEGKLSIFSVSFSGTLCLMASADERVRDKITSVCAVGSFGNIKTTLSYLINNTDSDPYGMLIILKNFIHYSIDAYYNKLGTSPEKILKALDIAIQDNFYKRNPSFLKYYLEKMTVKDRYIFTRLVHDPDYRNYHWNNVLKNKDVMKMADEFDIPEYLKNVSANVLLLHGMDDNVIPSNESLELHSMLKQRLINAKLLLTPLLGHSNIKLKFGIIPHIFDLVKNLSFFFNTA